MLLSLTGADLNDAGADAGVPGGLDREVILGVIRSHRDEIKRCYERELAAQPFLECTVRLRFRIGATGAVISQDVAESADVPTTLARCVTRAAARWVFAPPLGGGEVAVTFPYVFKVEGAADAGMVSSTGPR